MSLIERYLSEMRSYLPKDRRDEVCDRLRTDLEESLTRHRTEEPTRSVEDLEVELLTELGPPAELADGFVPRPRVLFGPRLYPPFLQTMKIALGVLIGLAILGSVVDLSHSLTLGTLLSSLASACRTIVTGGLVVLGVAVVVFSAIERSGAVLKPADTRWDPRQLSAPDDPDRISYGDVVASIAFLVIALVVVNFFRSLLGVRVTLSGEGGWLPLLGAGFDSLIWLLDLCLVIDLLFNVVLLLRGRWSLLLRWSAFAVNVLWVAWLWQLSRAPSLLGVDPARLIEQDWSAAAVDTYRELISGPLATVVELGLKVALIAALVGLGVQLARLGRRMFAGN